MTSLVRDRLSRSRTYWKVRRALWTVRSCVTKLMRLRPREWKELLHAQLLLFWAQALVWTRPAGKLVDSKAVATEAPAAGGDMALARRLALQVNRVADFGPVRSLCLVRAVAINRMLESHGMHGSRLRIGVRKTGTEFAAHAWIEYGGEVIGDEESHVKQFAELTDVNLIRKA